MSDTTVAIIIALIAAVPATLASLATLLAVCASAWRAEVKLTEVHTLVNSASTEQKQKIEELQTTVKTLLEERGRAEAKAEEKAG